MITSIRNDRVASAVRLKKRAMREKDGRFLVEGAQVVGESLSTGAGVVELFHTATSDGRLDALLAAAREQGVGVHAVSDGVMGALTSTVTPQGVVGVAGFLDRPLHSVEGRTGCVPVLVEVRDPGNAGTILRSADAAGARAVVFTRSSVDVYNPKVVRATAGSLFHVPVVREVDPAEAVAHLRGRDFVVLAADAAGETSVYDLRIEAPVALLLGNEARGLAPEALALADITVRVPIRGRAESLNLAAAATVLMFEVARWHVGRDRANDRLGALVAAAAHDLRSPMTSIRAFAETLGTRWDAIDDAARRTIVQSIGADAVRGGRLIGRLADVARAETGLLSASDEPVDLAAEARTVAVEQRNLGATDVAVTARTSALVRGDRQRLGGLISALVEAAAWWGREGPVHVEIAAPPGPTASIRIWRAGEAGDEREAAGLLSGDREAARPDPAYPGAALLIEFARAVVRAHRGRIGVGPAQGEGGIAFDLALAATPSA